MKCPNLFLLLSILNYSDSSSFIHRDMILREENSLYTLGSRSNVTEHIRIALVQTLIV